MINQRRILACLVVLCGLLAALLLKSDSLDVTELTFSKESGFYDKPFYLEINAPVGTEIFYTLDGSDPDENAEKYTEPIKIIDATENENVYSLRKDVSADFLVHYIEEYGLAAPNYVVPDYNIDKCTVVKSAYKDADGNFSETKTGCYFIGYDNKAGYDNVYIMSVVTDPDNLFDSRNGIYVLGDVFEDLASSESESFDGDWFSWNANYFQRGLGWERDANIQLFDTKRNMVINKNCGIRVQGGCTRGYVPRSLNMYAREQYDGEGRFYYDLFGTGYMADKITLSASGNDYIAKFKDMLMASLIYDRDFAAMNYIPCIMFLDGEYWGIYWITERYDKAYLEHYYGTDEENAVIIKAERLDEGAGNDYDLYLEMMEFMENKDLSEDANYEYACKLIDMQSYIDYYAAQIYIGRTDDWPGENEALWRARNPKDSKYSDGKWRWMLYDVNWGALSSDLTERDTFQSTMDKSRMFYNLCQNKDFKKSFATTFMDLVNTSFTNENTDAVIGKYINLMSEPMYAYRKRFFGSEDIDSFMAAVADIKIFLDNRRPYILKYLKEDLGLTGNLATVELEINDASAGRILLNTIEPSLCVNGKWEGEYYTDFPITLTAVANDGYKFVEWEISCSQQKEIIKDETINVYLSENGNMIKAIYERTGR